MKKEIILFLIIAVVLVYYFRNYKNLSGSKYSIPSEYKGSDGLNYIEREYSSELNQAESLCVSQFKGNWVETSNKLGCYNMEGFSIIYCNMGIIQQITNLCVQIGGNPTCTSKEASCTV